MSASPEVERMTRTSFPKALRLGGFAVVLCCTLPSCAQDQALGTSAPQTTLKTRTAPPPAPEPQLPHGDTLAIVNGVPYQQPSRHDIFIDYVKDTYGLPAFIRTSVRTLYAEARGKPTQWDNGPAGIGERFASSAGITMISGNTRFAMEVIFHEDLRYYPCLHCSVKRKIENALLAEITARHDADGHRFFTLTPTVADFSGPIVAHAIWFPGNAEGPIAGVVSARTYFATRIGYHVVQEFYIEHHHKHPNREAQ